MYCEEENFYYIRVSIYSKSLILFKTVLCINLLVIVLVSYLELFSMVYQSPNEISSSIRFRKQAIVITISIIGRHLELIVDYKTFCFILQSRIRCTVLSVSYTHLDVYKRQVHIIPWPPLPGIPVQCLSLQSLAFIIFLTLIFTLSLYRIISFTIGRFPPGLFLSTFFF